MACRPTNRAFIPESKDADKPRRMHHKHLHLSPYGIGSIQIQTNEEIPSLLGGLPQTNPNLVTLPAHTTPNDNALSRSSGGGTLAHYDKSYQAARPIREQKNPGLGPRIPPKNPIMIGNF